jgi:tRNA threonylcarbamoyladenosine biosynthesis protein TsaB
LYSPHHNSEQNDFPIRRIVCQIEPLVYELTSPSAIEPFRFNMHARRIPGRRKLKILAMETFSKEFSIALLDTSQVIYAVSADEFAQSRPPGSVGSSSILVPMIAAGLQTTGWNPRDLDLIVLPLGPGSFTGLRVGVVTAKAFSYVNRTPLIGVNSLEVIAAMTAAQFNLDQPDAAPLELRIAINAQRQQLFCGRFESQSPWHVNQIGETTIENRTNWLQSLSRGDIVSGSGLKPLLDSLDRVRTSRDVAVAPNHCWSPTAVEVGHVGRRYFEAGRKDDPWAMLPVYYRPSAAEEKARERGMKP